MLIIDNFSINKTLSSLNDSLEKMLKCYNYKSGEGGVEREGFDLSVLPKERVRS